MSNSRNNGPRGRYDGEVPFKDFLFYLYQSATPSPASTREGSISRGYQYKDRDRNQHPQLSHGHRNQHHVAVAQSLERIQGKSEMLVEVASSPKKEAPTGKEGNGKGTGGGSRIVIHHQQHTNGVNSKSKKIGKNQIEPSTTATLPSPVRKNSIDQRKRSSVVSSTSNKNVIPTPPPSTTTRTKQPQLPSKSQHQPNPSTNKLSNDNAKLPNPTINQKKQEIALSQKLSSLSVASLQSTTKNDKKIDNQINHGPQPLPVPIVSTPSNSSVPSKKIGSRESLKNGQNGTESRNESRTSYRELLGDCQSPTSGPSPVIKQGKNKSSSHLQKQLVTDQDNDGEGGVVAVQETRPESHSPRENEDPNLHLCVHPDHDLSFFKNFSATASRSKSSLAEWSLIHGNGITEAAAASSHQHQHQPLCPSCLYAHQYQFYDHANGHNSSTHQICCNCNYQNHLHTSKRHSRSTPIALDVINLKRTGNPRTRHQNGDRDHFPHPQFDHGHLLDYEQFSDEWDFVENDEDEEPDSSKKASHSDTDQENETKQPRNDGGHSDTSNKSHNKVKPNSKHNSANNQLQLGVNLEEKMLRNSTSPLFQEDGTTMSTRKGGRKASFAPLSNTKSSTTLDVNDIVENGAVALTPRRIDTLNASGGHGGDDGGVLMPVSTTTRKRGGGNNGNNLVGVTGPGSTTTTVTLKMDTNSMFMDTVYVNLKQDIDTASSIKLFY